jgi:3-dehydroquinate dehydratase/shikimate dehydrogenase
VLSICVSLTDDRTERILGRMAEFGDEADLFEIRGDFVQDLDLLRLVRGRTKPLLFACRSRAEGGRFEGGEPQRRATLLEAMRRGFDFVDVEHRSGLLDIMLEKTGRGLLVSFHDFEATPANLKELYLAMCGQGADVVKIAVTPRTMEDVGRLVRLCAEAFREGGPPLVGIAMGPMGLLTRLAAGRFGAPFTYASPGEGREAGPGQLTASQMAGLYRVQAVGPKTRVYGVLGSHVQRSLSPAIHNAAFAAARVDALYVPLETEALAPFLRALPDLDLAGFSVTRPFKTEIVPHLAELDESAAACGSVNTVVVRGDALLGASTDGLGILSPLRKRIQVKGARAVVLGAGGAARAAAWALQSKGARTTILARDGVKAGAVAAAVSCEGAPLSSLAEREWDLLVNATPVGDTSSPGESLVPAAVLRRGRIVFDMVYDPLETRLLREARTAGLETISGLEMLVAQAAAQFELWTGREAPLDAMRAGAARAAEAAP